MCHFATLLALASLRSRRTAIIPAYSCRRHPRLKVYPHLPHKPHAQTSRIDPPIKHPLNYLASHNSLAIICRRRDSRRPRSGRRLARQPKTSSTTTSNAPTSNIQEREPRNKTLKKTSRNEDQHAQETPKTRIQERGSRNKTPKNEGQHALNSRSPLVGRNTPSAPNLAPSFPPSPHSIFPASICHPSSLTSIQYLSLDAQWTYQTTLTARSWTSHV